MAVVDTVGAVVVVVDATAAAVVVVGARMVVVVVDARVAGAAVVGAIVAGTRIGSSSPPPQPAVTRRDSTHTPTSLCTIPA
tara:strand:- start:684 stop:926 length:243 start_codon:yes stop_codon:yes gene_type:complete